jgi:hypothetical protein
MSYTCSPTFKKAQYEDLSLPLVAIASLVGMLFLLFQPDHNPSRIAFPALGIIRCLTGKKTPGRHEMIDRFVVYGNHRLKHWKASQLYGTYSENAMYITQGRSAEQMDD